MYSNLISKARNVVVEFHLRSGGRRLAGKIHEVDEVFVEVMVQINEQTGEFAQDRSAFEKASKSKSGWRSDRILINIRDISMLA
jgi:hypothetical protein